MKNKPIRSLTYNVTPLPSKPSTNVAIDGAGHLNYLIDSSIKEIIRWANRNYSSSDNRSVAMSVRCDVHKASEVKSETKGSLHPVSRSRVEETAPYVENFLKFNTIVRQKMYEIANVYYLKRDEQSFYIFRTTKDTYFGFELCCGELEELLDNTKAYSLISNPLDFWDEIQKA